VLPFEKFDAVRNGVTCPVASSQRSWTLFGMSLKTTYRPTPFHAGPSAHNAPVHSRTSGVLPIMYFLKRSSSTFQTAEG